LKEIVSGVSDWRISAHVLVLTTLESGEESSEFSIIVSSEGLGVSCFGMLVVGLKSDVGSRCVINENFILNFH
jgi:hypothetical protein